MLFRALNLGAQGLRVAQAALSTIGNNIANVDVQGYSRQRVEIEANSPSALAYRPSLFGNGASVTTVSRANDDFYERQSRSDLTARGFYDGRTATLDSVERLYTNASDPNLGSAFDDFFNSARQLTQEPDDLAVRGAFIQSAQSVAVAFNNLDRDLRTVQRGIDDALSDKMNRVNELAKTIANMNAKVVSSELDNRQANDYRDTRDQAVRELSSLVSVNCMAQADGSLTVEMQGGNVLAQGDQYGQLQGVPNAANLGLLDVNYIGPNGTAVNLTQVLNKGELGGLLDVRDKRLAGDLNTLDTLAQTFANTVNVQHQAGFGLDGIGGRQLFLPPVAPPGTAANLAVDPVMIANPNFIAASQTALTIPGDNRNMQALADLQNQAQVPLGNATFNRRYGQLLHDVGLESSDNTRRAEVTKVKAEQSESLRESVEGVSIDDEMVDLTRFQKHFEASSKIVTTVDALLNTVMQLIQ